jgi:hypothetical protein
MKALTLIVWLCLGAIPAFAQSTAAVPVPCSAAAGCGVHGAPAPLLGLGLPSILSIGGVLLGFKLLKRKKQS